MNKEYDDSQIRVLKTVCGLAGEPLPNMDANGIRFGVINSNRVSGEAVQDIIVRGRDLTYEAALEDAKAEAVNTIMQFAVGFDGDSETVLKEEAPFVRATVLSDLCTIKGPWTMAEVAVAVDDNWDDDKFNNGFDSDDHSYLLEDDGYSILLGSDGDIFVQKSPWIAMRGLCSPCAPNACNLETEGVLAAYALGEEWFDDDTPMPYKPQRVDYTDKELGLE